MNHDFLIPDFVDRELAETTFDRNVVVVAGAGTGKTTLLVNRLVYLLMKEPAPVPITQIVALTFTNKAATEMKVRLRERLALLAEPHENESAMLAHGDAMEPLPRLALAHARAVVALLHRHAEQRAVETIRPAVIRAPQRAARIAAALGRDLSALVGAAIGEDSQRAVGLPHKQQRSAHQRRSEKIAGLGHLRTMRQEDPGTAKEALLLESENVLAEIHVAMHAIALEQRLKRLGIRPIVAHPKPRLTAPFGAPREN